MILRNLKSLIRRYPVAVVLNFTGLVAALLVAGLCGCEKNLISEIDLANNLEGSRYVCVGKGIVFADTFSMN